MPSRAPNPFCSDLSRESGESLVGTAPCVDVWFLIEVSGDWGKSALASSALPQRAKDQLRAAQATVSHARIELIQQEGRRPAGDFALLVARSSERSPVLYQFTLKTYDDLELLDLGAIAAGDPRYDDYRIASPLYLVCTNGKRDRCCARNGLAAYHGLAERAGDSVWQCTHLGGHRLSANVVVLPDGLVYGRVSAEDVAPILAPAHVHLSAFRGRTCYDAPAQAAETFLRESIGDMTGAKLVLAEMTATTDHQWEVSFDCGPGSKRYLVKVEQVKAGFKTFESCGDAEPSDVHEFRLSGIQRPA